MSRRSRYSLTKVSADLPTVLVQQLDNWKGQIQGINRSHLIGDLLVWALEKGAVDELYPECAADHDHRGVMEREADCACACLTCAPNGDGKGTPQRGRA